MRQGPAQEQRSIALTTSSTKICPDERRGEFHGLPRGLWRDERVVPRAARRQKSAYLAPPSEKNLDAFKRWTRGSQREKTFAEYLAGKVCAVDLNEGDTPIIPSGLDPRRLHARR